MNRIPSDMPSMGNTSRAATFMFVPSTVTPVALLQDHADAVQLSRARLLLRQTEQPVLSGGRHLFLGGRCAAV